jgi:hypothetical protein
VGFTEARLAPFAGVLLVVSGDHTTFVTQSLLGRWEGEECAGVRGGYECCGEARQTENAPSMFAAWSFRSARSQWLSARASSLVATDAAVADAMPRVDGSTHDLPLRSVGQVMALGRRARTPASVLIVRHGRLSCVAGRLVPGPMFLGGRGETVVSLLPVGRRRGTGGAQSSSRPRVPSRRPRQSGRMLQ